MKQNYKNTKPLEDPIKNFTKQPPQAIDLEEMVLGAFLLEQFAFSSVADICTDDMFYSEKHKTIYVAMRELYKIGKQIDLGTVVQQLKSSEKLESIGGSFTVMKLTHAVSSAANLEAHVRILQQFEMKRKLILMSATLLQNAYDESMDVFESLDTASKMLQDASNIIETVREKHIESILKENKAIRDELASRPDGIIGASTGDARLDSITQGLQAPDFNVFAGATGMGKTAFGLKLAIASAKSGHPTVYFSYEMSENQLMTRTESAESGVEYDKFKKPKTLTLSDRQKIDEAHTTIHKIPFFAVGKSYKLNRLVNAIKRFCIEQRTKTNKTPIIFIDYIQLVPVDERSGTREQDVATITRTLKATALEMNCCINGLAQLSRAVTNSADKKPDLQHLRESGSIEMDADMVAFVYRPEYYGFTEDESGELPPGLTYLLVRKYRNGGVFEHKMIWRGEVQRFEEESTYKPIYNTTPVKSFHEVEERPLSALQPNAGFDQPNF